MKIDSYSLKARYAPALITIVVPVATINHFFVSEELYKYLNSMAGIKITSNVAISAILLYFLSEVGRIVGKNIFEKILFKDESRMPTTNLLMYSDETYSHQHKKKFREKVLKDLGIELPTLEEESKNESEARKRIVEVVALIRKKLHLNSFLLQHNIEYGAMRNLVGGAVVGLILSIGGIVFFHYFYVKASAVYVLLTIGAIYAIIIVFGKVVIEFYGKNYAKILIREYLTDNG